MVALQGQVTEMNKLLQSMSLLQLMSLKLHSDGVAEYPKSNMYNVGWRDHPHFSWRVKSRIFNSNELGQLTNNISGRPKGSILTNTNAQSGRGLGKEKYQANKTHQTRKWRTEDEKSNAEKRLTRRRASVLYCLLHSLVA
ncbi:uncharacterized protein E5676_scaffold562G00070 [Cucumis melo var. makuwa]|uniref:Uncharacterized protein n=1 Tax=Cucumis melo var. makuwa TaxID=1194695 RepID=A0A5D3BMU1_CUCMM|nr:uncharacterized protein E5676_scaffold562G00070 [Cucumis melo var. makuwa]